MTITIIFEPHSTTYDNEQKKSSGWNDIELSPLGVQQSLELFERRKDDGLTAIYCSDLQRAYKSAIHFKDTPIIQDKRLRECDYGEFTQVDKHIVDNQKVDRIKKPFPNGESYNQCAKRMGEFIEELAKNHNNGDKIMIIGHRATQYGLNHHILGHSIEKCVTDPWKWQPGWVYQLEKGSIK